MKNTIILITILSVSFTACSRKFNINYKPDATEVSKIVIQSTKKIKKTTVSINDDEVIHNKGVKRVTFKNVPPGDYKIHITSDYHWYNTELDSTYTIHVKENKVVTKKVKVPQYSTGYWVVKTASWAVIAVVYVWYLSTLGLV